MNRIILIGNGFDLAHGLKTGYRDFINDFWKKRINEINICNDYYEDDFINIENIPFASNGRKFVKTETYAELMNCLSGNDDVIHNIKNQFLIKITESTYLKNWVDIEAEYYASLLELIKTPQSDYTIQDLNKDFKNIQNALEKYLTEIISNNRNNLYDEKIYQEIYSNIHPRELSSLGLENLVTDEIKQGNNMAAYLKHKIRFDGYFDNIAIYKPENILFLNFNYTSLSDKYLHYGNFLPYRKIIHIHGELNNNTDNKIIFGYGDEIDENYKQIENLNDNNYLENVKSIKYLESRSYRELLYFINSNTYQVLIFGHSCGISDRTLLNTLFEHPNCQSIKPYYHKISDTEDNYSEIVRNISRNFKDKALIRDKVVNKTYTKPLKG